MNKMHIEWIKYFLVSLKPIDSLSYLRIFENSLRLVPDLCKAMWEVLHDSEKIIPMH